MPRSIATQLRNSQVMLTGVNAHAVRMARRGLDDPFLERYDRIYREALELDNQYHALKARIKEMAHLFHAQLAELDGCYREARKVVKLEMPLESWPEFGIRDQR